MKKFMKSLKTPLQNGQIKSFMK